MTWIIGFSPMPGIKYPHWYIKVMKMRNKMPWIDVQKCDIAEKCEDCKAARFCPHGAFMVIRAEDGGSCRVGIDFEKCRLCGNCSHACDQGAVRMV